jgi:hypothetical protein
MELAKSLDELNKRTWYRLLKAAFVVSFVVSQTIVILIVRSRTEGKVIAPISFKLVGSLIKEEVPAYRGMTDEEAGKAVYQVSPALWADYAAKYEKRYVIDPVSWYEEYAEIQRAKFCVLAFLGISLFFEVLRRAFYYVIFGRVFPPKKRRRRRRTRGSGATGSK